MTSVTPNSGSITGGTVVTIGGTNFLQGATVTFGGAVATAVSLDSATSISATTPPHAIGAVDVAVTNPGADGGSSTLTGGFTYHLAIAAMSITPSSGSTSGGTTVTITGSGFQAGATVSLGGSTCSSAVVVSSTSITCTTSPHAAGVVDITVVNPGALATTLTGAFGYTTAPPPTIIATSPGVGFTSGGTVLTVTGTNFQAGATVTVGGVPCVSVTVVSSTSVTCTTPAHTAGTVSVTVANLDGGLATMTNGFGYTVRPPTFTSISPNSGPTIGASSVTLTGTNFQAGATATFGGVPCSGVVVASSTSITCTTPAHAPGAVNVVVTNPDGGLATLANGFSYTPFPPMVTSVSPSLGSGGATVTISGVGFQPGLRLTFGGTPATSVTVLNATSISAVVPAHSPGAVSVTVTNSDGGTFTLASGFVYLLSSQATVNFDALPLSAASCSSSSDAVSYLSSFGITFVSVDGGAFVQICNATNASVVPASPPNYLYPRAGASASATYDLVFSTPLASVSFTRSGYTSFPLLAAWSAQAYNASGAVLSTVSEPAHAPSPGQSFVLTGPGITRVRVQFNTNAMPPFLDDLVITP